MFNMGYNVFVFMISWVKSLKRLKINKKGWKRMKKVFQPAFRCQPHPKAGRNKQDTSENLGEIYIFSWFVDLWEGKLNMTQKRERQSNINILSCERLFKIEWL